MGLDLENALSELQKLFTIHYPGRNISLKIFSNYLFQVSVEQTAKEIDVDVNYIRDIYIILDRIVKSGNLNIPGKGSLN